MVTPMQNSQEHAYQYVKKQILSCDFGPGQRLVAMDIASELGLSRTPVREALSRLEQENLVARESGWGYVVKTMSFKDVMDLYRVRESLEVEAAVEAVAYIDDDQIGALRDILSHAEEVLETRPFSEFLSVIRSFTAFIAAITGNTLLQTMVSSITDRVQIVGAMMVKQYLPRAKEILDENREILDALVRRDVADVECAMRNHIRNGRATAAKIIGPDSQRRISPAAEPPKS